MKLSSGTSDQPVPYRRIVVLHLTIVGSGFALAALQEPLAGLTLLVLLKTVFDVWHWKKDREAQQQNQHSDLTPDEFAELKESTFASTLISG